MIMLAYVCMCVCACSQLSTPRSAVSEVPAVYFIEPTEGNIQCLIKDLREGLYDQYYFHFSSHLKREHLEELAKVTVETNQMSKVIKVTDQYLDFACIEPNLYSFNLTDSYRLLNHPETKDEQMERYLGQVTEALLSLCTSLGRPPLMIDDMFIVLIRWDHVEACPLLRYEKGTPSEALARRLEGRLKDHMPILNALSGANAGRATRPDLLLILDRNVDLVTPLKHKWSYGSLVYDVLDVSLNRISLVVSRPKGSHLIPSHPIPSHPTRSILFPHLLVLFVFVCIDGRGEWTHHQKGLRY